MEDFQLVTIRLRKGDREALSTYFHPKTYNHVIRHVIGTMVDGIRGRGQAMAEVDGMEIEIKPEDIDV